MPAEHMATACAIMRSCLLAGGPQFVPAYGAQLASALTALLGNVSERGSLLLLPVMEIAIQVAPEHSPQALEPALQKLLALLGAGDEPETVVAAALGVLSRLLLHAPGYVPGLFERAAAGGAAGPETLLLGFVDMWMDKFDVLGSAAQRKLSALAACNLLGLPIPGLLSRLDAIVATITAVWFEVRWACDQSNAHGMSRRTTSLPVNLPTSVYVKNQHVGSGHIPTD